MFRINPNKQPPAAAREANTGASAAEGTQGSEFKNTTPRTPRPEEAHRFLSAGNRVLSSITSKLGALRKVRKAEPEASSRFFVPLAQHEAPSSRPASPELPDSLSSSGEQIDPTMQPLLSGRRTPDSPPPLPPVNPQLQSNSQAGARQPTLEHARQSPSQRAEQHDIAEYNVLDHSQAKQQAAPYDTVRRSGSPRQAVPYETLHHDESFWRRAHYEPLMLRGAHKSPSRPQHGAPRALKEADKSSAKTPPSSAKPKEKKYTYTDIPIHQQRPVGHNLANAEILPPRGLRDLPPGEPPPPLPLRDFVAAAPPRPPRTDRLAVERDPRHESREAMKDVASYMDAFESEERTAVCRE